MYLMLHFTFINAWIVTLSRDPAFKFTLQSNLFKLLTCLCLYGAIAKHVTTRQPLDC